MKAWLRAGRAVAFLLTLVGGATVAGSTWLMLDGPIVADRYLVVNDQPRPSRAIVCIGGGIGDHQLPLATGWDGIYTAVQLYADGFAPVVIFSGGGRKNLSEADVYAEAAVWLGLPRDAAAFDATPGSTAEHPRNLLKAASLGISRDTPLIVVTSPLHAKRTELCFRKAGFTEIRMVTDWVTRNAGSGVARDRRRSAVAEYRPSGRRYDDPLNVLSWKLGRVLATVRELTAIGCYRIRGDA